jgi:hydrogenase-1 operon protein HyaF
MNDADRAALKTALGQGEVSITLQSMGESRIYETAYAGIWWLSHFDVEGRLLSELIEICRVPAILVPHQEDIARAAATLGTVATRRSAHD